VLVGLLNLEPKYQNLALEKIRIYHTLQGDVVEDYLPLRYNQYDKIYCSSIFTFTPKRNLPPNAICGGTGFDLTTTLPSEIEVMKPRINKGFTTRGCFRDCPFCVVRTKEGGLRIEGAILDLWDGKAKLITLLDNNPLGLLDHFEYNCRLAIEYNLTLDWNQGLDHRCLTQKVVDIIKTVSHKELHFAFDNPSYLPSVERAINLLQDNGINRCNWYVLVGFDTTFEEDLFRLNYLRDHNQNAYVQRYNGTKDRKYIPLARWANQHHIFHGMTWGQFLDRSENKHYAGVSN
jgi:hypothetical protein